MPRLYFKAYYEGKHFCEEKFSRGFIFMNGTIWKFRKDLFSWIEKKEKISINIPKD